MKIVIFILIELMTINGEPEVVSRLLEISNNNGKMIIEKSEFGYLGNETIEVIYTEDKYGEMIFSFISKDDNPRTFISEEPDELTYIEGDVMEGENKKGSFILRKVSGVSVDEPW